MAHDHRKLYWQIFGLLAVLTALEVGLVYVPGLSKGLMISGLVLLALVKASLVGLFYMHLSSETTELKLTIAIPLMIPMFYALVLIIEAGWRMLRNVA